MFWYWECTPAPCGLPTDEMLTDGIAVALGELSLADLAQRNADEMASGIAEYRRARLGASAPV